MSNILNNSIWLEHPKYPGYRFSPEGNCLSLIKSVPKIIKNRVDNHGYISWNLNKGPIRAHRIIASIFLKNNFKKPEVNHKNGVKSDNNIVNLEWVTKLENIRHAYKTGLKNGDHKRGSKNNFSKLKENIVKKIKEDIKSANNKYGSQNFIAKKYGIHKCTVSAIKTGRLWAHLK